MEPIVRVVYDRKKDACLTGTGVVEVFVRLAHQKKTYVRIDCMSPKEWEMTDPEIKYAKELKTYRDAIKKVLSKNMELNVENFNKVIHRHTMVTKQSIQYKYFTDFMFDEIQKDRIKNSTRKRKLGTLESLQRFGGIKLFTDLVPEKLKEHDEWLHNGEREDITIHTYHKNLRKYCRIAYEKNLIAVDPYTKVHFSRGKCKERNPLNEDELTRVRNLELSGHIDRARDLFIFAAYTGMAYCDVENFDFKTMAENIDGNYYIDGRRIKTESNFFTPILPYAMEVLEKYNFVLPKMSNQKINDFLRVVASHAGINKKMTFHIARHSFATIALSHDIPIDKVARMLGHKDIKTTQVYAKVLKKSIVKHTDMWAATMCDDTKSIMPQEIQQPTPQTQSAPSIAPIQRQQSQPQPQPTPTPSYQPEYPAYPEYSGYSMPSFSYSYV